MTVERILILDDELIIRKALEEQLRRKRLSVCSVSTLKEAQEHLAKDEFDLLFVDVHLPDGEGTELLDRIAEMPDPPLVVIITGNGTVESAVECMRSGAFDYIIKPFSSSQIDVLMKKAKHYRQLVKVNQFFTQESAVGAELIGKSEPIQDLRSMVSKVAPTEATVLIEGENGTGKELVASELYRLSARKNAPFIKVNCAAISETLIESEFSAMEKGAFTGAMQRREGRFELADGGTILLDEISEISPKVQAKLLRVLQEREFERVGGNKTIKVDVRVIATTNRDLMQFIDKGEFREDLYYRLNVFPLSVPPLRERDEDIVLLAKSFAQRFSRKHGIKLAGFEGEAIRALAAHNWPGNVRELQNTIERAVILTEPGARISAMSLGLMPMVAKARATPASERVPRREMVGAGASSSGFSGPEFPSFSDSDDDGGYRDEPVADEQPSFAEEEPLSLEQIERQHILRTLESTDGNKTQASNILGISIRTLRNKLSNHHCRGAARDFPGG